ncbi:uncharacterized protein LOC128956860 [Oppia nitens]|uniref:uncharacterized protein LOC128956860 n=1 Tax=Oppia nitens TaxID=1686743 RepID=UPI0023DB5262|nr:uncharacterized protein LOC128956860 [Oppia nitens]
MQNKMTNNMDEKRERQYPVPEFRTIFPIQCNPFNEDSKRTAELTKWWSEYALLPADIYQRRVADSMLEFGAYFYPHCTDWKRYANLVKWLGYLFVWDDHNETQYGEFGRSSRTARPVSDQYLQCLDRLERMFDMKSETTDNDKLSTTTAITTTTTATANNTNGSDTAAAADYIPMNTWKPYVLSTYVTVEAIMQDMTGVQRLRFIDSWRRYLRAQDYENRLIEQKFVDFDSIKKARMDTSANATIFALLEYSDGLCVPEREWLDPRFQRLLHLANFAIIYVNDVYSFEKELYDQKGQLDRMFVNLVAYYILDQKCSIREAMDKTLVICRQHESEFDQLAKSVANDPSVSSDTKRYVQGLATFISGNYHMSITLNRYNNIY